MKLLIVDDQLLTLNGIAQGINWREEGFDVVETAQNAMEARISFSRAVPDVMLATLKCRWKTVWSCAAGCVSSDMEQKSYF